MSYFGFFAGLFAALIFLWAGIEWLALVMVLVAFITLAYTRTKHETKKAWTDMKKTDAFYPEKKFLDTYPKGAGKTLAENLIPAPNTEVNAKGWLHKTNTMASNFFKELEELFK